MRSPQPGGADRPRPRHLHPHAHAADHYHRKRAHYGLRHPDFYDRDLRRLFSDDPANRGRPSAANFISRFRREIRRRVSRWTGVYQYTIDQVLKDIMARCRELNLPLTRPEDEAARVPSCSRETLTTAQRAHRCALTRASAPAAKKRASWSGSIRPVPPEEILSRARSSSTRPDDGVHVLRTLRELATRRSPVVGTISTPRNAIFDFKPHIVCNLLDLRGSLRHNGWRTGLLQIPSRGATPRGLFWRYNPRQ